MVPEELKRDYQLRKQELNERLGFRKHFLNE